MISIHPELNPLEVIIVTEYYQQKGVRDYTLTKGNDCIWGYHGLLNEYFIFSGGRLVDIQID